MHQWSFELGRQRPEEARRRRGEGLKVEVAGGGLVVRCEEGEADAGGRRRAEEELRRRGDATLVASGGTESKAEEVVGRRIGWRGVVCM